MKKLLNRVPNAFSRFYNSLIPSDKIAHKLWEDYAKMYK